MTFEFQIYDETWLLKKQTSLFGIISFTGENPFDQLESSSNQPCITSQVKSN